MLSIVFQLAGAKEYSNTYVQSYDNDITSYFESYKEHELIKWIPEIREQYGIGYDAVATYAIHLKIENGKIGFIDNVSIGDMDERWEIEVAEQFLEKLNKFYTDSKFNDFFIQHKLLYTVAEENFTKVLDLVDFTWFEKYYGTMPEGRFHLIVSIKNGGGNYGPSINFTDGRRDNYAIIGTWKVDSTGNPIYPESVLSTIVHEFNHPFCNPLIYEFYSGMKEKAEEFYNHTPDLFIRQAYGEPQIVMCEILVRASVIQYYKSIGETQDKINELTEYEQKRGFTWIDVLCNKLDEYEQQRNKYPTLYDFMPEIVKMVNELLLSEN